MRHEAEKYLYDIRNPTSLRAVLSVSVRTEHSFRSCGPAPPLRSVPIVFGRLVELIDSIALPRGVR